MSLIAFLSDLGLATLPFAVVYAGRKAGALVETVNIHDATLFGVHEDDDGLVDDVAELRRRLTA